jgi:hypothetical protein
MSYKIKPYSYKQAEKLNVEIKPSKNPKKKIDVYKNNKKIASIGAIGYNDFPSYLEKDKQLAEEKRKNYQKRHYQHINKKNTPSYFAGRILW